MNTGRRYYFLVIAELKNLTRAAEKLMVSQPSLTQYLNKLEQDLGVTLLDRHYSPLRLTDAGAVYYDYLRDQREREEKMLRDLEAFQPRKKPTLHIGLPLQKSPNFTRGILPRFIHDFPGIELSIWEGTAQTVRERIVRGELEIGFGYSRDGQDDFCTVQPLGDERVLLVCHRESPMLGGAETAPEAPASVQPDALRDMIFYQMSPEYYLYDIETEHLRRHGADPARRITMSNLYSILNTLASSPESGFAYIPDYIFEEKTAQDLLPLLGFFRLGEEDLDWQFSMLRRKGKQLTRDGRAFWNRVLEEYRAAR